MMIRALLIAFGLLCASLAPASAQGCGPTNPNCVVITAPNGDNTNKAASTAFVQNAFGGGSSLALASGKILIGQVSGFAAAQTPSGDLTASNAGAFTFNTVNANVGAFGSATQCPTVTVNAKGLATAASATNCTPAIGSITGLGAGIATFLATPSSANLRGALTDETGTGSAVFAGGNIGAATATSLNGNIFTAGSGTLTLGAAKTATINNTLTLAGTDGTTQTFPSTSATIARTDAAQTFSGTQTFAGAALSTSPSAGIGYATGSGGAVTQLTSRATGVTLNTITGAITLFNAAGSTTAATFTVTDSAIAATDVVVISQKSGSNAYVAAATTVGAGSFNFTFFAVIGTAADSPVFNFAIHKAAAN